VEQLIQDLRYGLRTLVRQPGFALTAVLALALGIGANTAVFSVVYAVLLKPLPFPQAKQLIYAHDTFPAVSLASVSWPKFLALRDGNRTLTALAAIGRGSVSLTGRGEPEQVVASRVSGDYFTVLGVAPHLGRLLNRDDDVPNGGKVIALSYGLWQRRYGGDPGIVGQAVTVDREPFTVAGVMPQSFNYPSGVDAWVPLALGPQNPGNSFLRLIGRMKPGVSLQQARDDLSAVTAAYNEANKLRRDIKVYPLHDFLASANRRMLLVLQGTVAFVLLIACANVANLLLARSVSRGRELSIRAAIGAGRLRLVRQLLTESLVLALAGGVAGVLLAGWLLRLFLTLAPANFAGVQAIGIDLQVLLVTLAVSMATGVLFGLAPARHGFHVDPNDSLRDTGPRGATRAGARGASRLLVVAEIALAMMLVSGAGLMVKSLVRLESQDPGFRPEGVMTFQIALPAARYPTPARAAQTIDRLLSEVRSIPGVRAAGAINMIPLINFGMNGSFSIVGRPPFPQDSAPVVEYRATTSGYFQAMGLPLKRGREFTGQETAMSAPVVIINQTMADQFWPNANAIGERVLLGFDLPSVPREIVGVVGDARGQALSAKPVPESYVPYSQAPFPGVGVVIRTQAVDPASILPAVRQRVDAIDADLPLVRPQTMETVVAASAGSLRLSSVLTALFALLAGVLASLGIYSLIAYSVAERTRELGIRVALGADRRAVMRLIVGEGLALAGIGIAIGLAGSWLLTGSLRSLLYEVSPLDPAVIGLTCLAVLLVTAVASYVPARRALRVDPMSALRAE
jgi:putative ABC transport system permease protein